MQSIQSAVGVTLAILLILAVLVLGILAWRKRRQRRAAAALQQLADADNTHDIPDKSGSRLIWRPGEGGQP